MDADSVVLDTGVLLTATTPSRRFHKRALALLDRWPNRGIRLAATSQILREYLVVATRPRDVNGLDLTIDQAITNIQALLERMRLLIPTRASVDMLTEIVRRTSTRGKVIHDANVVVTMASHGVQRIVTANPDDFRRFDDIVEVIDLAEIDR